MRRLFFALLFVNIAYFAWAMWVTPPPTVPPNEALARLPPLKLVSELPADQRPDPDAIPTRLPEAVTVGCMSVGPFPDVTNSAQAAALLKQKGYEPKQRAAQAETIQGFGVFIGGLKTEAETDKVLAMLERAGIKDALIMPATADAGRRVSLGLFSERARAERRVESMKALGLKAEVTERKIPGTVYWVDLAPQPGMNTVPLQDLFAEGVSSKVTVQPCPAPVAAGSAESPAPQAATPTNTASMPASPPGAVPKLP